MRLKTAMRWGAEFAGVGLITCAAGYVHISMALLVAGLYLLLVANHGGE